MSTPTTESPDSPELADRAAGWAGAYVHIPFCARVCPYCDFAVVEGRDELVERYVDALVAEIRAGERWRSLDTVFIGGGTPSRIPAAHIARLLAALADRHGISPGAEVSLEANPEDWDTATSDAMRAAGVTRVSFGAQSFDPAVLESLGRRHTPKDIEDAVGLARESGFESISLDVIFGTPGESPASWATTLDRAVAAGPDHVSTYALTVELGTPLSRAVRAGAPAPDDDDQADKYEAAVACLEAAGLVHYETSNFARPGHACRHNLATWAQGEYLAAGLGAHRHMAGVRSWNVRSLDAYLARLEAGESPVANQERIGGNDAERERLLLGLRRRAGVMAGELGEAWLRSERGRRVADVGLISMERGRMIVTNPLLADTVGRELIDAGWNPGRL